MRARVPLWFLALLALSCGGVSVGSLGGTFKGILERKTCSAVHESVQATVSIDGSSVPGGTSSQPFFAVLFTLPQDSPPSTCILAASATSPTTGDIAPGYTCPPAFDAHFMTASTFSTGDNEAQASSLTATATSLDVIIASAPVCCAGTCAGDTGEWIEFDGGRQ